MIYEFIATLTAAFGMAGIALIIRHLGKLAGYHVPKWIIPSLAACGIFAFQIHQEYNWFDQKVAKLPEGVIVIKKIEDTAWFRPWSYLKPQTVRFMAADLRQLKSHPNHPHIKLVNLYLFARHRRVHQIPQLINCRTKTQAQYIAAPAKAISKTPSENIESKVNLKDDTSSNSVIATLKWLEVPADDPLLMAVCSPIVPSTTKVLKVGV